MSPLFQPALPVTDPVARPTRPPLDLDNAPYPAGDPFVVRPVQKGRRRAHCDNRPGGHLSRIAVVTSGQFAACATRAQSRPPLPYLAGATFIQRPGPFSSP